MSPDAIMAAAIDKVTQSTFRNRPIVNRRITVQDYQNAEPVSIIPAQCDALFSPGDESKKGVGSSAVKLLVRRRLRRHESHHCQKLCQELRAEMPPRVPDEIFRSRSQTTYWRAFQVRMKLVHDDECLCSF